MSSQLRKVIISGGGTGGHIFPAVATANRIKEDYPDVEILFIALKREYPIHRIPVKLVFNEESSIKVIQHSIKMLFEFRNVNVTIFSD